MDATFPARRIQLTEQASRPINAMLRLEAAIELDPRVRHLVQVRASQINGCAFCNNEARSASRPCSMPRS